MTVIGIDLGTTNCCVGFWDNTGEGDSEVKIITNEYGSKTTPSYVAFTNDSATVLIGKDAKAQRAQNPENTVYGVKRLIGRQFNEDGMQDDIKNFPFKVINDNGVPKIEVSYLGELKRFSPTEISAMVLKKMLQIAETHRSIGENSVTTVVVSVPASFTEAQLKATSDAAKIAKLPNVTLLHETTAAAIAYGLQERPEVQNILVVDFGGGTLELSLLTIKESKFEVKEKSSDPAIGGKNFTQRLVDHYSKKRQDQSYPALTSDGEARLRIACDQAKIKLSSYDDTKLKEVDDLLDGIDPRLTRDDFEKICDDLFKRFIDCINSVLSRSEIDKSNVHEVVLVGGSTRIPRIIELVKDHFNKEPNRSIDPDEAIAHGATAWGAKLDDDTDNAPDIILDDVAAFSFGIETRGGVMAILIKRGSKTGTPETQDFTTHTNNQRSVRIKVFAGERKRTADNTLIGDFELSGIAPAPRGVPRIEVTFKVDDQGFTHVTATEKTSGKSKKISVTANKKGLSAKEIERKAEEAKQYLEQDAEAIARIAAMNRFESYIYVLRDYLDGRRDNDLEAAVNEAAKWLKGSQTATRDDYGKKQRDLEAFAIAVMKRAA
jgi:L1 cell adhesion molecule like protein